MISSCMDFAARLPPTPLPKNTKLGHPNPVTTPAPNPGNPPFQVSERETLPFDDVEHAPASPLRSKMSHLITVQRAFLGDLEDMHASRIVFRIGEPTAVKVLIQICNDDDDDTWFVRRIAVKYARVWLL